MQWLLCGLSSTAFSLLGLPCMTVILFFLNDSLIMKFLTPSLTLISYDAVSGAQTSLWAFQILHDRAPGPTARGESGLFMPAKPGSSLFSVHARCIPSPFLILLPVIPSSPSVPNQILPFLQASFAPCLTGLFRSLSSLAPPNFR